jgi:electron transfer flavoprotein alpha subunit
MPTWKYWIWQNSSRSLFNHDSTDGSSWLCPRPSIFRTFNQLVIEYSNCRSALIKENCVTTSLYGKDEEQKSIWVFLEQFDGVLENVSLELLHKGRELADGAKWLLVGLLIGKNAGELASASIAHGADEVWVIEHDLLERFTVDAYTEAAFKAIMKGKPSAFLCGATPDGRDLAGRLAVRLRTGLNADCTDLRLKRKSGILVSEVTGFGGGVLALLEAPDHRPQMSTVRPGVFTVYEADFGRMGEVIEFPVDLQSGMIHTSVLEKVVGEGVDLTHASALVCGGRGIDGNFELMAELAELLGGEVGATRPPVDEGHIERERQVGQTGVICRPKVVINCGISGAFHFVVGIQEADIVVSINSDAEAPIFDYSDYCIVGDVSEVVPALVRALHAQREESHA